MEWEYLFDVLNRFGLGSGFVERVLVNGSVSDVFPLSRGMRQGCPLSPLLFALPIEPLAETIRTHQGPSGVKLGDIDYRISLYADDVLLFITNPENSILTLISILNRFVLISGCKIN